MDGVSGQDTQLRAVYSTGLRISGAWMVGWWAERTGYLSSQWSHGCQWKPFSD